MNTVTAGIIGLGYWGPNLLRNFAAAEGCNIKYGCDLDDSNLEKQRARFPSVTYTKNADDLFNDPDVNLVIIATATSGHYPLAKQALEAGKHVFIEKPMTETSEQARELNAIAKENGLQIFVDHTFVFAPAVERITSMATSGELGELLYFDSSRINLGIIQKDTNVLWDLAVHDLSILSTFKDLDDITEISAHGDSHYGEHAEVGHLHLSFKDGFHAHIHVSWLAPVKIRHTILGGAKAMITYDDTEPSEKLRVYDKGVDNDDTKPDPFFPKYRSGDILIPALALKETLLTEAEHVIGCLQGNETARAPGEDGRKIVQVLEKADASLASRGPVPFQ